MQRKFKISALPERLVEGKRALSSHSYPSMITSHWFYMAAHWIPYNTSSSAWCSFFDMSSNTSMHSWIDAECEYLRTDNSWGASHFGGDGRLGKTALFLIWKASYDNLEDGAPHSGILTSSLHPFHYIFLCHWSLLKITDAQHDTLPIQQSLFSQIQSRINNTSPGLISHSGHDQTHVSWVGIFLSWLAPSPVRPVQGQMLQKLCSPTGRLTTS